VAWDWHPAGGKIDESFVSHYELGHGCLKAGGIEGPESIAAFLTFLDEKMYPGFKFIDVKSYIDTSDQAFGEIHHSSEVRDFRKRDPSAFL
jgi:hypothetical protein